MQALILIAFSVMSLLSSHKDRRKLEEAQMANAMLKAANADILQGCDLKPQLGLDKRDELGNKVK